MTSRDGIAEKIDGSFPMSKSLSIYDNHFIVVTTISAHHRSEIFTVNHEDVAVDTFARPSPGLVMLR